MFSTTLQRCCHPSSPGSLLIFQTSWPFCSLISLPMVLSSSYLWCSLPWSHLRPCHYQQLLSLIISNHTLLSWQPPLTFLPKLLYNHLTPLRPAYHSFYLFIHPPWYTLWVNQPFWSTINPYFYFLAISHLLSKITILVKSNSTPSTFTSLQLKMVGETAPSEGTHLTVNLRPQTSMGP